MFSNYFKPPANLDYDAVQDLPKAWERWREQFEIFLDATEASTKEDAIKVNILLNLIGPKGMDIYRTFTYTTEGDNKKLNKVFEKFEEHVKLHKSVTVNRFLFFKYNQKEGQTLENYIKELTKMSKDCDFDTDTSIKDSLLRDKIISGINDKRLQEKLLRLEDNKSTLTTIISTCRTHEVSIEHSETLDESQGSASVNRIGQRQHSTYDRRNPPNRRKYGN